MIDRASGGNLWVMPPRDVWDRSELSAEELIQWAFLVAASGKAMLIVLPQLKGGVINYWEAGNWSLNHDTPPAGPKTGTRHKSVHLHLIGRSPQAEDADWQWGEAPIYPRYREVSSWWSAKTNLSDSECHEIAICARKLLIDVYGVPAASIQLQL